jgi:lipid II:glycine glycyltransferase (peptidoglycan interpeptide bridge formation enzyme)
MTLGVATTVRRIVDGNQWNGLVQGFAGADFKQGFEWGEVRREQGWSATRFAAFQDGACVAACSVLTRRIPGLGAVVYAPRGPLFHKGEGAAVSQIVGEVRRFAESLGAILVRFSPGIRMDDAQSIEALDGLGLVELPEETTTWNTPRYVQVLDLRPDEKTLLGHVRKRMREYIAAAPRKGVLVEPSDREEDLVAFHALMVNVGRIKGFPVRDLGYYRTLLRHYRGTGSSLLVARAGGAIVGGLLAIHAGRQASMLYTSVRSTAADGVKHHLAPAITWEFVRRARQAGCETADLGGSGVQLPPTEADHGWGVYHFKAGLGCTLETFVPFRDLVLRQGLYKALRVVEARVLPQAWTLMSRMPSLARRLSGVGA